MTVNLRIGRVSRALARALSFGYADCLRCHTPWNLVDDHITQFTDKRGCLPLCEKCFAELTPEQRLPFYRELIEYWHRDDDDFNQDWPAVESAVLEGR